MYVYMCVSRQKTSKFTVYRNFPKINTQALTIRSQIRISPFKQPEARMSSDVGLKAKHQGVRGWPLKMWVHFPVTALDTRTE